MTTTSTNDNGTKYWSTTSSSPTTKHAPIHQELPDSPEDLERYAMNSDDLQSTSHLHASSLDVDLLKHSRRPQQPITIVGSHEKSVTLGRGGSSTIKIGRRNRQISRTHVSIAYNKDQQQFELTVVGLNGACVDQVQYAQHDIVSLDNDSFIDILGDYFYFKVPPPPLNFNNIKEDMVIVEKKDIFGELSPEAEEQEVQQQEEEQPVVETIIEQQPTATAVEEEEEDYPIELVPEDALSSADEKELSPEPSIVQEPIVEEKQEQEEKKPIVKKTTVAPLQEKKEAVVEEDTNDYAEVIIDALVFSRTSSMPISDICSRILKGNPAYAKQPRALWIERIRTVLKEKPFFGEIQRKGKTADGSPTENLYYYNSEKDPVEWRRATYTQVGRSARKCTLKDKQYFWKIPPKLGRHRSSYVPPAAVDLKRQRGDEDNQHDAENVDPKKTKY